MKRWLVFGLGLAACGGKQTPSESATIPPDAAQPTLAAVGDWQAADTEAYQGKQDDIYFASPKVGFYGNGSGKVFRTDDAGKSWSKVLEKPGTYVRALGFLDDQRGFLGNIGPDSFPGVTDTTLLYRTDDGGHTWTPVALPEVEGARGVCAIDILAVDAVNAGHRLHKEIIHVGGRVGGPASLFGSDDGGATWQRMTLPTKVAMILDVKFVDVSTGFLFAGSDPDVTQSHGVIAKTSDSGRTWKIVYESARPFELMWKGTFVTRTTGYATLQNYTGEAAQDPSAKITPVAARFIVKTTDGGDHWAELPMIENAKVQEFGVGFVDALHGWVGAFPQGFETVDGGVTWTPAANMPAATNKIRVVRDGATAKIWSIGLDVRHLEMAAPAAVTSMSGNAGGPPGSPTASH